MLWLVLLLAGWCRAEPPSPGPQLTLWTPGRLDALHDALLRGRAVRAELTSVRAVRGLAEPQQPLQPQPAMLSLWVPRGQEQQAASEWQVSD